MVKERESHGNFVIPGTVAPRAELLRSNDRQREHGRGCSRKGVLTEGGAQANSGLLANPAPDWAQYTV